VCGCPPRADDPAVRRILDFVGMTIGGWLGWYAGAPVSIFTAFILGMVGTGVGLFAVRRFTKGML
jgi:hypothetical protein